ncbi:hypothetical protein M404DRAFT_1001942 [Pisolithus tinctorius Marx 270]|uniref:Uncharacterized protein n=1 Tax=Pisolithus tinctorius Marx 270 TaxID=870435 RepID=A0A0C3JZA3_PISTI|nr:hypothetical protein M404DRAFT_1001942 [Pisolithus tinctorius Marx 270]
MKLHLTSERDTLLQPSSDHQTFQSAVTNVVRHGSVRRIWTNQQTSHCRFNTMASVLVHPIKSNTYHSADVFDLN